MRRGDGGDGAPGGVQLGQKKPSEVFGTPNPTMSVPDHRTADVAASALSCEGEEFIHLLMRCTRVQEQRLCTLWWHGFKNSRQPELETMTESRTTKSEPVREFALRCDTGPRRRGSSKSRIIASRYFQAGAADGKCTLELSGGSRRVLFFLVLQLLQQHKGNADSKSSGA